MELSKLESTKEYEILTKINPQKILYWNTSRRVINSH